MTPVVRILLVANIVVFLLQSTNPMIAELLIFFPPYVLIRPWTLLTYMFLHAGFQHIFFNMLALFFFGPRVEMQLDSARFLILYFISGLTGAVLNAVFSPMSPIVGASAGVFGVMLAFAYYWPHEPVHIWGIIPVPARVLVVVMTALSIWSGFSNTGGGIAHFAHLGGYLGAFLYLKWVGRKRKQFRKLHDATPGISSSQISEWQQFDRSKLHPLNREEFERILAKIEANGVQSLTPAERLFLSNFAPSLGNGGIGDRA